jgi:hypothetical protein
LWGSNLPSQGSFVAAKPHVPAHCRHDRYIRNSHSALSFGPGSTTEPELTLEEPGARFAKDFEYNKLVAAAARYCVLV